MRISRDTYRRYPRLRPEDQPTGDLGPEYQDKHAMSIGECLYCQFNAIQFCHPHTENLYTKPCSDRGTMAPKPYRALVFALYQFSLVLGIALLPVALVANRAGIPFPVGQFVDRIKAVYQRTEQR